MSSRRADVHVRGRPVRLSARSRAPQPDGGNREKLKILRLVFVERAAFESADRATWRSRAGVDARLTWLSQCRRPPRKTTGMKL
jgi:hypothetical protein